jgi:hypothetical protein
MGTASSIVLEHLMDGKLESRGRPTGGVDYEVIPKETWRLAGLSAREDNRTIWRIVVIPRHQVPPDRIKKLLSYDSIIVNSRNFEALWPASNRKTDAARKRLLKKAKAAGADPVEIKKVA